VAGPRITPSADGERGSLAASLRPEPHGHEHCQEGGMFDTYADSFDAVWATATPVRERD